MKKKEASTEEINFMKGIWKGNLKRYIIIFIIVFIGIFSYFLYMKIFDFLIFSIIIGTMLLYFIVDYFSFFRLGEQLSVKYVKEKKAKGENPYVRPWVFGLMYGLLFAFLAIYYLFFEIKTNIPFNYKVLIVGGLFIITAIVFYFIQKNTLKKLENINDSNKK
jgi:hypothetical protein